MSVNMNISVTTENYLSGVQFFDNCAIDINFSAIDFPNQEALTEPLSLKEYVKLLFYAVVLVVALIGNIGVILTVALNRTMRTTINFYLVNLATADLLICCCCMWIPVAKSLSDPLYVLGSFICKLNPFSQMTCLTSSVLTLAAIACDRFIAIIFPLHVRVTKQRTGFVISFIWLLSVIVATPLLLVQKYNIIQWKDISEASCYDDWPPVEEWDSELQICLRSYPLKQTYYAIVTLVLYFVPILVMITAYLLIIARLWRTQTPGERNIANINLQHRAKKKVIRMVCVVLCGFVICWTPFQATVLYSQFVHSASQYGELPHWFEGFSYFSMFLAYFNSALNPLLYGGFNKNFRQGLCNVLKCSYVRPLGRIQFSQKSRTTHQTGLHGSPSSGRINGVGSSQKLVEMKSMKKEAYRTSKESASSCTSLDK
ncbi:QRFP-like peptide receptor [Uloborus diversus]|uniref:QRFP-like peptide receptor n=1 Tax=Uloborus diversus TaxID=327109 RepID=UPI00240A4162|nr:QRFP-like peptide receptor [Uloborus diversus]